MTEKIYLLEYKVFNFFVGGGIQKDKSDSQISYIIADN